MLFLKRNEEFFDHKGLVSNELRYFGAYLTRGLSNNRKYDCMLFRHQFTSRALSSTGGRALISGRSLVWKTQHENEVVAVNISKSPYEREGELAINFLYNTEILCTLTFTVIPSVFVDGLRSPILFIGGIQGAKHATVKFRQAMKINGELSPAATLLVALGAIGEVWEIHTITAVSAKSHVCSEFTANWDGLERSSVYDKFWLAAGARAAGDLYYELDAHFQRNESDDIIGGHKSRTRRRRRRKESVRREMIENLLQILGPAFGSRRGFLDGSSVATAKMVETA